MISMLLASPMQGWRLVYAPALLWMCALGIWLRPRLTGRSRAVLIVFALAGMGTQGIQLLRVQRQLKSEFADRMMLLRMTSRGDIVTLPTYSLARSPWFQGDELGLRPWRVVIARTFNLAIVSPVPGAGEPALVLEHQVAPPVAETRLSVATRLAPAAAREMRQACLALRPVLAAIPGHELISASYRLDAIDDTFHRPIRACAHRGSATIAPDAGIERVGPRAWNVVLDLGEWKPDGSVSIHAITPGWRVLPPAPSDGDYRVVAGERGRHQIVACDRVECFLAGSVMSR